MKTTLNNVMEFFGSANVQKIIGVVGGPALATDTTLPLWIRGAFAVGGPTFTVLVHAVDAWRASISGNSPKA